MQEKPGLVTIIAGSREGVTYEDVELAVKHCGWNISHILSGAARGADQLGEQYAKVHGIELTKFPAQWDKFGKSAGYLRNTQLANNSQALIALWDGASRGTSHMIDIARDRGLFVYVNRIGENQ